MEEADKIQSLEQERNELRLLINEGVAFTVPYTEKAVSYTHLTLPTT